jgi:hypothetical protein
VFDSWGACDIQQLMMVMVMVMVMVVMVMMMMMSPVLFRSPAAKEAPEAWDQNTSKYPAWLKGSKVQGCDMFYGYFMSFQYWFPSTARSTCWGVHHEKFRSARMVGAEIPKLPMVLKKGADTAAG